MILKRQTLELFGKMLFETATVCPPLTLSNPMPNEACFVYIIQGEQRALSEVESMSALEKEALLMKCGNYFSQMIPRESTGQYEAVAIHFYPEILKKVFQDEYPTFLKDQNLANNQSIAKFKADILLDKYFDSIMFYFENPELVNEELLILKLKELLLLLVKTGNGEGVKNILSNLFSPRTYQFKEVIESHLYDSLSLNDFCELTNLSLSSFKREFKKIFNDSPARYIKNKKLEKAKELLEISDLNVTQITFECGFGDLASFSVAFKDKFNISPSVYRQSIKSA
jgi:AraC-like DNA-binding protein